MKEIKRLSSSEKEVMDAVWNSEKALCVNDVFELLKNRAWKYTTIATFLSRLEKKGFLKCEKRGNQNYFEPRFSRGDYLAQQTDKFIKELYGGSARNLIASLCRERISEADYRELMDVLKKYDEN